MKRNPTHLKRLENEPVNSNRTTIETIKINRRHKESFGVRNVLTHVLNFCCPEVLKALGYAEDYRLRYPLS